jgi:DNA-binding response OmpR family regulator
MQCPAVGKIFLVNSEGSESGALRSHSTDIVIVAPESMDVLELERALKARGPVVERAYESESIAKAVVCGRPDAVIVDLRGNRDLAERLLSWVCRNAPAPALVITELRDVDARLRALDLGVADDLVAPFDPREGVVRVERLIARRGAGRRERVDAGDLTIDVGQRCVIRNGEVAALTPRELDVLLTLVQHGGVTVSKHLLLETVWGGEVRNENVVEANVSSLRRKVHALGAPVIHTVHRGGYVFRPVMSSAAVTRAALIAERDRMVSERDEMIARRDELIRRLRAERGHGGVHAS